MRVGDRVRFVRCEPYAMLPELVNGAEGVVAYNATWPTAEGTLVLVRFPVLRIFYSVYVYAEDLLCLS